MKNYIIKINDKVDKNLKDLFKSELMLETKKTYPNKIKILKIDQKFFILKLLLKEGRSKQIKRAANLLGFKLTNFIRNIFKSFYSVCLKEGDWKLINFLIFEDIK